MHMRQAKSSTRENKFFNRICKIGQDQNNNIKFIYKTLLR